MKKRANKKIECQECHKMEYEGLACNRQGKTLCFECFSKINTPDVIWEKKKLHFDRSNGITPY